MMATITIDGNDYFSYADVTTADEYLIPSSYYEVWSTYTNDQKGRFLIQATRFIDTLPWKEECGLTQAERVLRENIVNATIEIAARLSAGETDIISGGSGTRSGGTQTLKAGSAQISYFQEASWQINGPLWAGTPMEGLPGPVLSLIAGCLVTNDRNNLIGISKSFGTCYPSTAKNPWDFLL